MKANLQLLSAALVGTLLLGAFAAHADTPPEIIDPPLTQFAWVGRPVTFKVSFTNPPPLTFQWQWQGTNLADATNRTLRLAVVALTNGGDYRVVLANSAGVTTSAMARLTVRDWPQPTGVSFTNLSRLETNLQNVMRTHAIPGASLAVMKDGRLILARGYGYAVPETSEPVQPDSLFRIASLSKAITATAVLKLVDEDRLNLDDKVFPLLNLPSPTFPGAILDSRLTNITVRHLLNHTAGWDRLTARNPDGKIGFDPVFWPKRCATDLGIANQVTTRDLVWWITGFPLQSSPGGTFAYSNTGYLIAGVLVEQLTGLPYEEAIQSLFASVDITRMRIPATGRDQRMPDESEAWLSPLKDFRAGVGSRAELPPAMTADIAYYYRLDLTGGAAAWTISPIDYARFMSAIDGSAAPPDLLSAQGAKTMLTVTPASRAAGDPYGAGWHVDESTGEAFHDGFFGNGTQGIAVRRRDGAAYAVLCNSTDDNLYDELRSVPDPAVSAIRAWPTNDLFAATMSYQAWQARHFTAAELSQPEVSGDDADPDGDSLTNLVEYAQDSDPRVADTEPWLSGRLIDDGGQARLALVYRRRPLGHAVAYDVQASGDLKTWESFEATTSEELDPDGMLVTTLTETAASPKAGARFVRLTIRRAHPEP